MKIALVGAGAMGSLFGGLLTESGEDVWLLDVRKSQIQAFQSEGLFIEYAGRIRNIAVKATTDPDDIGPRDLTIIFVKTIHTESAAETAGYLSGDTGLVLTLQNGMGNAEKIARFVDPSRIIIGTTSHGATLIRPGHIRHAGIGATIIGMWTQKKSESTAQVGDVLNTAGIDVQLVDDILPYVWNKLLINVGINAITALTGIKNGQLGDMDASKMISGKAVREAMTVAEKAGISVRDDAVDHVMAIAAATGLNRSSMGQDVDNHRPTEIDAINGFIVEQAKQMNIDTPVNETLTGLIHTIQAHYES